MLCHEKYKNKPSTYTTYSGSVSFLDVFYRWLWMCTWTHCPGSGPHWMQNFWKRLCCVSVLHGTSPVDCSSLPYTRTLAACSPRACLAHRRHLLLQSFRTFREVSDRETGLKCKMPVRTRNTENLRDPVFWMLIVVSWVSVLLFLWSSG